MTKTTEFKEWFGDWYQEEQFIIQLDIGDSTLPVEFSVEDNFYQIAVETFGMEPKTVRILEDMSDL